MPTLDLNGNWQLTFGPQVEADLCQPPAGWTTIRAAVPGNVEIDLMAAGLLPDLTVGNNIYRTREIEAHEWWYRRCFPRPALQADQRAELVFEGIDCIADVWLDGQPAGHADNMLIEHRFDVTAIVRGGPPAGDCEVCVRIRSAVLEGRKHQPDMAEFAFGMSWESLNVRKAPHMYGWDIMPRLVSAGLWRGVHLDILEPIRWRSVYWATLRADPAQRTAAVLVDWHLDPGRRDVDGLQVRVTLTPDGGAAPACTAVYPALGAHGRRTLELAGVDLWWPRGYGRPALYRATLALIDEHGRVLAEHTTRIGLRALELRRTDTTSEQQPGEFVFVVNGERIYAKGTNWVPLDALHSRDPQHLDTAIAMAAELNCNMMRCWGGNVYEDHAFFDRCDENGILIWQDFGMACAIYPQTDSFADRIRAEAESVVAKLRNHPSLALWAGNNEIDETYQWTGLNIDPNTDRLSRQVLPDVTRRLDPVRPYLPSSPYRSPELVRTLREHPGLASEMVQPEQHLWGPRNDFKGPYYTTSLAHFVSEIGYHGCPDRRSLEQFLDPGAVWPWQDNDQWLTHATRPHRGFTDWNYRIALMARQTAVLFERVPDTLDDFILASQIVQAEAKKFFIERWRQGKWRRTGMLWWNLRDGWPIISDAIVDYYGRRKLAYEYIRRIQADVCAMIGEPAGGQHAVVVSNDTRAPAGGRVTVRDADSDAILFEGGYAAGANATAVAGSIPQAGRPALWLIDYTVDGQPQPGRNHYLAGPRPFNLGAYRAWLEKMGIQSGGG